MSVGEAPKRNDDGTPSAPMILNFEVSGDIPLKSDPCLKYIARNKLKDGDVFWVVDNESSFKVKATLLKDGDDFKARIHYGTLIELSV